MITDIKNLPKLCKVCQMSKVNPKQPKMLLFSLPVPMYPFQMISFNHRTLTRKTTLGNTYVLAIVDHYSNWTIYRAVPSKSAQATAKVIVEEVIADHGTLSIILSDRASGYTSQLLATINQILGIRHRFTATQSKRSNGKAERAIRRLNDALKNFRGKGIDDLEIENILPLAEIAIRLTACQNTGLTPFDILYGRKTPLPTSMSMHQPIPDFCNPDSRVYVKWLRNALRLIAEGVRLNQTENKQTTKENYDKKYKTKTPDYMVGQTVLLKDNRIEPNSN